MRARRFMKGLNNGSNNHNGTNGTNMSNNTNNNNDNNHQLLHRRNNVIKGVYRKESKVSSKVEAIKRDQNGSSKIDSDVETLVFRPGVRVIIDI